MPKAARTRVRVTALALLLLVPFVCPPPIWASGDATASIYWVEESAERVVQPMDPMSLADAGEPLSFGAGSAVDSTLWISRDGSTALVGHYTVDGPTFSLDVRAVDVETGGERSTFSIEGREAFVIGLSRDGSRVLVQSTRYDKRARTYTTDYRVQSTADGSVVSEFALAHQHQAWFTAYVDEALAHLWLQSSTVTAPYSSDAPSLGALVLHHVDLTTGRELGRLTLGSVEVGTVTRETVDQVPVFESVYPALALSPDGRTLAIVEAATEEIILLDGLTMSRKATLSVRAPASLARRLLGWTGMLPEPAAAKWQVGEWRTATFSADGEAIYLTGGHGEVTGDTYEDYEADWLGIRRVDLETGEVRAAALDGGQIDRILPVADGDIYVFGLERPWTETTSTQSGNVLRRLDGDTLSVEAERRMGSRVWQLLVTQP